MTNIITIDQNGNHVFDWSQIEYHQYGDYKKDKKLRKLITAFINKEGREGNHVWVLKAPPEMEPNYHQPDVYIPEWQFCTALDVIASVYKGWAETHVNDTNSSCLQVNWEGKAEFTWYDYRRWKKIDDERMGFNFAYSDNDLDGWGHYEEVYIDYDYHFFYGEDEISDWLVCTLIRSALKNSFPMSVAAYCRQYLDNGYWPYEFLWLTEEETFKKYPDIKEWAVNNGYVG